MSERESVTPSSLDVGLDYERREIDAAFNATRAFFNAERGTRLGIVPLSVQASFLAAAATRGERRTVAD